jgi:hypothetical protein
MHAGSNNNSQRPLLRRGGKLAAVTDRSKGEKMLLACLPINEL